MVRFLAVVLGLGAFALFALGALLVAVGSGEGTDDYVAGIGVVAIVASPVVAAVSALLWRVGRPRPPDPVPPARVLDRGP